MNEIIRAESIRKTFTVPRLRAVATGDAEVGDPRRERAGLRDRFHALRDISFAVRRGQAVGIIGANGSGKTTLLKVLAGVMTPTSGSVDIHGRVGALLELGAGFHPDLTGEENVRLNSAILGLPRREISRQLSEVIGFAGLERFMDMPVRHYSSGMIVRLGFATAIQLKPDILMLDETFSIGDDEFVMRAYERIVQLRDSGVNIMVVSHNIQVILQLTERVIWLNRGQIEMDGPAHEVLEKYRDRMGTTLLGGARVFNQLIGHAASMNVRESGNAARIADARWVAEDSATPTAPLERESGTSLSLEFTLKDRAHPLAPLVLEVWFMREEDHREIAFARHEVPSDAGNKIRIEWPRVPLGGGKYEATLTLRRADEASPWVIEDRATLPQPLVITTPPPKDFPVAAELAARWA